MKAEKLVFHIGHPKTGTTTVQRSLWLSHEILKSQGILFPRIEGHKGNAKHLANYLLSENCISFLRKEERQTDPEILLNRSKEKWQRVRDEIAGEAFNKLVLSSEQFFRAKDAKSMTRFNLETQAVAKQSEIVAYLRAPQSLILSSTQQNLKQIRNHRNISRTYVKDAVTPLMEHWHGDVSLNIFDRSCMKDGDIVTDFMSKYCPEFDPALLRRLDEDSNTAMSAEAMAVLLDLRHNRLERPRDYEKMISEVRKADTRIANPTKLKLKPGIAQSFINWRAPDLLWLCDTHGLTFPDIDYAVVDANDIDDRIINFEAAETICEVNADRKAKVYELAMRRTAMPPLIRRWMAKF